MIYNGKQVNYVLKFLAYMIRAAALKYQSLILSLNVSTSLSKTVKIPIS